ncbi:MAG TPA: ATP-binding protein [Solirubrobacteraceae bacterium]|nr:ATP-binding protein [Solirubrobacteraceae bacterium]
MSSPRAPDPPPPSPPRARTNSGRDGLSFDSVTRLIHAAVEQVAATDPNPTDPFRGLYVSDDLALMLARSPHEMPVGHAVDDAVTKLGLDELDAALLVLCLAPELDPRYGRLLAYLHDDLTRKLPSPRLAARLLSVAGYESRDVLARFARDQPLRQTGAIRLLDGDDTVPLAEHLVRVGEPLVGHVLGARLGPASRQGVRRVDPPADNLGRDGTVLELRRMLAEAEDAALVVCGPDGVELLAAAVEAPVMALESACLRSDATAAAAILEARLAGGRMCVTVAEEPAPEDRPAVAAALAARAAGLVIWAPHRDGLFWLDALGAAVVEVPAPSVAERRVLWRRYVNDGDADALAAKFRHSAAQIARATRLAELSAIAAGRTEPSPEDLHLGARRASSRQLEQLAVRLPGRERWEELVLPQRSLSLLKSISAYLRYRERVLGDWGYDAVVAGEHGVKVLFFGESGTGKTMAARVLAGDLGLELYRIDLATVISKYIGETEKNLDRIFAAAQDSNAILFFDEADAVFGKRSEVKDAHDRYANIEVAYMLQKMESYDGAVILATNLRSNIDDAFLRRLDLAIEFPFPEPDERRAIWRRLLPTRAPVAEDVDLDLLAGKFRLSGGSIRNCSLAAAFLAADDGGTIAMRHLLQAVFAEYLKLGRLTLESDFERFRAGLNDKSVT